MMRVFFLNRYFFPDHSATSQILSQLAFDLAASGRDIHVVASRQLYDNPAAQLPAQEIVQGITVHRVGGTRLGRSGLAGRALDYMSFYAGAHRKVSAVAKAGDILVAMTDPPLLSILGAHIARRKELHLVNWLQDIYPEVASELGVPFVRGPVTHFLSRARNQSLRKAAINVVVGDRMAEMVLGCGVPAVRIRTIHNWSDDERIVPVAAEHNPLRAEWQLEGKFVVGYSGNLGRAHEFETLIGAAMRLREHPDIVFLFIGGGHGRGRLAEAVKSSDLSKQFFFLPYQDSQFLKYSLSVADVHWISLRPELEGLIVPSKVYGVAAAGRPIIAITAANGEIARLITQYDCGIVVTPGDANALADAIKRLAGDADLAAAMGRRARVMIEEKFTRRHALERWNRLFDDIEQQSS